MRYVIVVLFSIVYSSITHGRSYCDNAHLLLPTVVRITKADSHTPQGTAFFVDSRYVVTIGHVGNLFTQNAEWTPVDLFHMSPEHVNDRSLERVSVRRVGTLSTNAGDDVVVLELDRPIKGTRNAKIREDVPITKERVILLGFPRGMLRIGRGSYLGRRMIVEDGYLVLGEDMKLDLEDRERRGVFLGGASGSPIFDCEGRVVSVLNAYFMKQDFIQCSGMESVCSNGLREQLTAPPRGMETNLGVPVTGLNSLLELLRESSSK